MKNRKRIGLIIFLFVSYAVASNTFLGESIDFQYEIFEDTSLYRNQKMSSNHSRNRHKKQLYDRLNIERTKNYKDTEELSMLTDSLPSNMPAHTRLLWGRKGLIRKLKLAPINRRNELNLRRDMLQWHQRLGLVTLASLITQFTIGKRLYDDPAENYEKYSAFHKKLGYTTYGLYLTTASMSLLAPPAWKYSQGLSSIKIHRYLAIVHFSAMIIQPWLAYQAVNNPSRYEYYIDLHNQVGTIAAFSFSLAFLSTLFP